MRTELTKLRKTKQNKEKLRKTRGNKRKTKENKEQLRGDLRQSRTGQRIRVSKVREK